MKRRDALKTGVSLAALGYLYPLRSMAGVSANDKIQVGCIGLGGMGRGDMRDFLSHDDCEVVAVCDVDENHLNESRDEVKEKSGKTPDAYGDFRELLARDDIDAVMIGTPDHWHC
ncbi:MAG: Gfo/Idh/MocA family oxidoreductase, partial [Candidatus Omnitrophica bacterium]|nr:Gfo/Idh/MocA family oxidoreductase [Candidatus Omnitrophota bacterium]